MTSNETFGLCITLFFVGTSFYLMSFNWDKDSQEKVSENRTYLKLGEKLTLYIPAMFSFGLGMLCLLQTFGKSWGLNFAALISFLTFVNLMGLQIIKIYKPNILNFERRSLP